ncbi:flagellar hook-length control protein FliK [Shouchella shacheensis]|uniref:flagellar hook-length control protein FliK n=1 Tax=Shouchella shacheensis TaxID=1649580 RepID=UPI00074015EE|nr:flagellar hook-length control protein FliK [Shouchella shacheensis]
MIRFTALPGEVPVHSATNYAAESEGSGEGFAQLLRRKVHMLPQPKVGDDENPFLKEGKSKEEMKPPNFESLSFYEKVEKAFDSASEEINGWLDASEDFQEEASSALTTRGKAPVELMEKDAFDHAESEQKHEVIVRAERTSETDRDTRNLLRNGQVPAVPLFQRIHEIVPKSALANDKPLVEELSRKIPTVLGEDLPQAEENFATQNTSRKPHHSLPLVSESHVDAQQSSEPLLENLKSEEKTAVQESRAVPQTEMIPFRFRSEVGNEERKGVQMLSLPLKESKIDWRKDETLTAHSKQIEENVTFGLKHTEQQLDVMKEVKQGRVLSEQLPNAASFTELTGTIPETHERSFATNQPKPLEGSERQPVVPVVSVVQTDGSASGELEETDETTPVHPLLKSENNRSERSQPVAHPFMKLETERDLVSSFMGERLARLEPKERLVQTPTANSAEEDGKFLRQLERLMKQGQMRLPNNKTSEFTVKLHPETLGRLQLRLIQTEEGFIARISSDQAGTREMLERTLPQLRQFWNSSQPLVDVDIRSFEKDEQERQSSQDKQEKQEKEQRREQHEEQRESFQELFARRLFYEEA